MYKLVKLVALSLLAFSLASCGSETANNVQQSASAATDQVKNSLSASSSLEEITHQADHEAGYFAYGKAASAEEIAGWNIDIRPDGLGLPEGSGTVEDGEMLYDDLCSSCHGSFGEGAQGYPVLAGGQDSLTEARPEKTIGSFWAHASTLWDYIHRAMPFQAPESLEDDEVYAITAYVLYLNELVEDDFELSKENFSTVVMPNANGFYKDDRPDVQAERCMENCKSEPVKITSEPANATLEKETEEVASASAPVVVENTLGKETYQAACAMCHSSGVAGAPVTGDAAQWKDRLAKGLDVLDQSAINGIGAMPAKGGQTQLSDDAVLASVAFMLTDVM